MQILTKNGYKSVNDCSIGDEVLYYDLNTGDRMYNTILNIEEKTAKDYPDYITQIEEYEEEDVIKTREVLVRTTNDNHWFIINGSYRLFGMQSVWCDLNVKHVKDLQPGDVIYSEDDADVIIVGDITAEVDEESIWYRLHISGDCSYISDGITLHNASRFRVGGTGNWDGGTTTGWSATSGGGGGASVPTSADDVTFDSASNATAYTCTITTVAANCNNISLGNPLAGNLTFNGSVALNIYGNFTIASAITLTYSGAITFGATTTGKTITTNGISIPSTLTFQGVGGEWTLQDNLTNSGTGSLVLRAGTLSFNNKNVSSYTFSCSNYGTMVLNLGSGNITFSGSFTTTPSTGVLTINAGTSTLTTTGIETYTNSYTFYNVALTGSSQILPSSVTTFNNLTSNGTAVKINDLILQNNVTVNGIFTINGNSSINRLLVRSNILGTARTITAATVSVTNADFRDITGAGAGSWDLSAITGGSGDCGGNSGITFITPVTTNWQSGATWSTATWSSRVPLPQDTATFTTAGTVTITQDMPRIGSVDFTGSANKTWTTTAVCEFYGSINLTNLTTLSNSSSGYTYTGRGSNTINCAGKSWAKTFTVNCYNGTLGLASVFSAGISTFVVTSGNFTTNNYDMNFGSFTGSSTAVRSVDFGSSTITLSQSGTCFSLVTSTNLTFSCGTSTIKFNNNTTNAKNFSGGNNTFYKFWDNTTSTGVFTILGANTFNEVMIDAGRTLTFVNGATQTFTSGGPGVTINGTGSTTTIKSALSSAATFSKASGTVTVDNCIITWVNATGGATWNATNSTVTNSTGWSTGGSPIFSPTIDKINTIDKTNIQIINGQDSSKISMIDGLIY